MTDEMRTHEEASRLQLMQRVRGSRARSFRVRAARWLASTLGVAGVLVVGGCNTHLPLDTPPGFRGIVVPLPPPSFADADVIEIDVTGRVEKNPAGTRVLLYEYAQALGWFTYPDDQGDWAFSGVPIVLGDNCLQLDVLEGGDELLQTRLFEVVLESGPGCSDDPMCSATDEVGDCACLEPRFDLEDCSM